MKNVIKSMVMTAAMAAAVMVGSAQGASMSEHEASVNFGFRIGQSRPETLRQGRIL
jgi:hypothetical protein